MKVLFYFTNDNVDLVEVKREDLETDDKSKLFFWLLINNDKIERLTFQGMSRTDREERRFFDVGVLRFNQQVAYLTPHDNSYTQVFRLAQSNELSEDSLEQINDFINSLE